MRTTSRVNPQARPPTSQPRNPKKTNIPPANLNPSNVNSDRPRPRRVFDARSLAASQSGAGQPAKILRTPRARPARPGPPGRGRKPRAPAKASSSRDRKAPRRRAPKQSDAEEGDDLQRLEIEKVYRDLTEESKQSPTRYNPRQPDFSHLMETWPAFPTGVTAHAAGVVEKLTSLSERTPHGYVPPYELGKRLFKGQYVRFVDAGEKEEALAEAQRLSQQRADEYSQRKGDLVEPEEIKFNPVSGPTKKALIQTLVQGSYPKAPPQGKDKSPILHEVTRTLANNETYQTVGKTSQFTAKVESLLAAGRPAKRA
ncbi:hypothetical protein BDV59DRAFT_210543 [Aspergillus ambiguus]|uniref:uncharacterized protein n=1 Tax=Aspergillus ambiguus TaxID=176160 RepID=UPI003CCE2922